MKEEAEARLQAEERTKEETLKRAEAEEQLEQKIKLAEEQMTIGEEDIEEMQAEEQPEPQMETNMEESVTAGGNGNGEKQADRHPEEFEIREIPQESPSISPQAEKFVCDCCGRNDLSQDQISRIDSGHLFCPDCLAALRR